MRKKKSSGWKKISNALYSFGAAIVIIGALAKLTHFQLGGVPVGNLLLTVGLITEAFIFFISAFEKVPTMYEWDKVYPELTEIDNISLRKPKLDAAGLSQLNTFFQKTHFDNDSIERLGAGLQNLGNTATKLNNISDASLATDEYVNSMKKVSESMEEFKKANKEGVKIYSRLTKNLAYEVDNISERTAPYFKSIDFLTAKIEAINSSYDKHLEKMNTKFTDLNVSHKKVNKILNSLDSGIENMQSFKEQTNQLNRNLNSLNQIYNNMILAMSSNQKKR